MIPVVERQLHESVALINEIKNLSRQIGIQLQGIKPTPWPPIRRMRCIKHAVKEAKNLQNAKIKTLEPSGIDLRKLKEIFGIALSGHISQQGFPTTQQDITSRLLVSNATDLATGQEIVKHQFLHFLLQGPPGSQDLPNQDSCQTLTRDKVMENFEDDFFSCEENLFNVSDIEDHQPLPRLNLVLKDTQQLKTGSLRKLIFGKVLVHQIGYLQF